MDKNKLIKLLEIIEKEKKDIKEAFASMSKNCDNISNRIEQDKLQQEYRK